MKKWSIAAVLYLAAVIGGYSVYAKWFADEKQTESHGHNQSVSYGASTSQEQSEPHGESQGHSVQGEVNKSGHQHGSGTALEGSSEVSVFLQSDQDELKIFLKDKSGNPVEDLEVNHEKLLHLIVVDDQLHKYYHLHPEQTGKGEFTIGNSLPDGFYKAFVDIKPKSLAYHVAPVPFIVGNPGMSTHSHGLQPDKTLSKNVDGETVKLTMSSFKANEPVKLTFDLDKTKLTPYLGAMGHVVILDENAQNFLHVHPANDKDTVFETQFEKPGIYKIWAEFKQNGKVRAFPFVVEIK
ncbi:hypothetical protein PB1_12724 [Bacillus methanolicus PB1]|uniref:Secreted protein n=1 Tax=Bacillus methanolicus PB1 TaxID=997296 RepID=I3DW02_BACMT|nr:hypothetical protein [Bacillus methanolicus]EIJ78423.1 hypothetical protein PB1_12724 [Bacillus methanolicus PB1]